MVRLPMFILHITKFKGGGAEDAINALVLLDADMDRGPPETCLWACGPEWRRCQSILGWYRRIVSWRLPIVRQDLTEEEYRDAM